MTLQTNQFFYGHGNLKRSELNDEKMKTTELGGILKQVRRDLNLGQDDGYDQPQIEDECIVRDTEPDEICVVQQPAKSNH